MGKFENLTTKWYIVRYAFRHVEGQMTTQEVSVKSSSISGAIQHVLRSRHCEEIFSVRKIFGLLKPQTYEEIG